MLSIQRLFALVQEDYTLNGRVTAKKIRQHTRHLFRLLEQAPTFQRELRAYAAKRLAEGAAPATVNRELAVISKGFRLAEREGEIDLAPRVPRLAENNRRTGFLSPDEFARIYEALASKDVNVAHIARWLYLTGWRKSEAKALTWDLVDRDLRAVSLTKTKTRHPRRLALWGPLVDLLEERKRLENGPFVFHRNGKQIRSFRTAWARAVEAAGLPRVYKHDMRRSFARNAQRAGVPRKIAKEIAGWRTDCVYERYAIVDESDHVQAFRRMYG